MPAAEATTWISLLRDFGLPVVILFFVGYALWRLANWAGEHAIKPVVASHVEWVKVNSEAQKRMTDTVGEMKVAIVQLAEGSRETNKKLDYLVDAEKQCDLKERVAALEDEKGKKS